MHLLQQLPAPGAPVQLLGSPQKTYWSRAMAPGAAPLIGLPERPGTPADAMPAWPMADAARRTRRREARTRKGRRGFRRRWSPVQAPTPACQTTGCRIPCRNCGQQAARFPPVVRDCLIGPAEVNDSLETPSTGTPPLPEARWQSRQWQTTENIAGPGDRYHAAPHKHRPVNICLPPSRLASISALGKHVCPVLLAALGVQAKAATRSLPRIIGKLSIPCRRARRFQECPRPATPCQEKQNARHGVRESDRGQ